MKTKKNIGVLSMNETYKLNGVSDAGEDYGFCDNCGRAIRYIAELEDSKGNIYNVGTECAKTLSEACFSDYYELCEKVKELKKIAEVEKVLNRADSLVYIYENEDGKRRPDVVAGRATDKAKAKAYYIPEQLKERVARLEMKTRYIINDYCMWNVFNYVDLLNDKKTYIYYHGENSKIVDNRI